MKKLPALLLEWKYLFRHIKVTVKLTCNSTGVLLISSMEAAQCWNSSACFPKIHFLLSEGAYFLFVPAAGTAHPASAKPVGSTAVVYDSEKSMAPVWFTGCVKDHGREPSLLKPFPSEPKI